MATLLSYQSYCQKSNGSGKNKNDTTTIISPVDTASMGTTQVTTMSLTTTSLLPTIIPPAPNAANLGQFAESPVGAYTGTPEISVPLWTVAQGDIQFPISLAYHSGGIKVGEMASWVGLGWSLNAGGVVTRTVRGLMDEDTNGYLNIPFPDGTDKSKLQAAAEGTLDTEPDMFYVEAGGLSCRFVFDKSGNIHCLPKQKIRIESLGTIVSNVPAYGNFSHIKGWKITDTNGIVYKFEAFEKTITIPVNFKTTSSSYKFSVNSWYLTEITSPTGDIVTFTYQDVNYDYDLPASEKLYSLVSGPPPVYSSEIPGGITTSRTSINAKRLQKISFANGSVDFSPYSYGRADFIGDNALEKVMIKDKSGSVMKQFYFTYDYMVGTSLLPYSSVSNTGVNNYYTSETLVPDSFKRRLMLQKVVEQNASGVAINGGYKFEYFHDNGMPNRGYMRCDHWGYANQQEVSNPTYEPIIVIGSPPNLQYALAEKEPNATYAKQGSLYKITYPTNGYTIYEYNLHEAGYRPLLPDVFEKTASISMSIAHAGYNYLEYPYLMKTWNGSTQKHYYQEFTVNDLNGSVNINITLSNIPSNSGNLGFYMVNTSNPTTVLWQSSVSGTTPLTLSNGTYRLFHYPWPDLLNNPSDPRYSTLYNATIEGWYQDITNTSAPYKMGGLRVSKVTTTDPVSGGSIIKTYEYVLDGISTGEALSSPLYFYDYAFLHSENVSETFYKVFNNNSSYPLCTTRGNYTGYSLVTERTVDTNGAPIGKTEYAFRSPYTNPDIFPNGNSCSVVNQYPFAPADNFDWSRGQLTRKSDYKYESGSYSKVKETRNSYTRSTEVSAQGRLYGFSVEADVSHSSIVSSPYSVSTGLLTLDNTVTEEYSTSGSFTTDVSYIYSSENYLPVKISKVKSDGSKSVNYYSYPLDYSSGTGFIDDLVSKNIVSIPVEEVTTAEETNGTISVVSGIVKEYSITNPGKPSSLYKLETQLPVAKSGFKFSSRATGTLPPDGTKSSYLKDTRYKLHGTYSYDENDGRITQFTGTGDNKISFLWGYNGQYPVARVENATYSQLKSCLTSTEITNIRNGSYSNATLLSTLNKIRSTLTNSLVKTYTYTPLWGMTSETDPTGVSKYYSYDNFGRLISIKNDDSNLLDEYEYHYVNP